jgi:hypothetical protein
MSKTTNKFSPEVRARAVRLVLDHEGSRSWCFRNEAHSMLVNWLPWSECTRTRPFGFRRQLAASNA